MFNTPNLNLNKRLHIHKNKGNTHETNVIIPKTKSRRAVAWLLLVVLFVTLLPLEPGMGVGIMTAEAIGTRVLTMTNSYDSFVRTEKRITLEDPQIATLTNKQMSLFVQGLGIRTIPGTPDTTIQFAGPFADATVPVDWNVISVSIIGINDAGVEQTITYGNVTENVPEVSSVETPVVDIDDVIILNGSTGDAGIKRLKDADYSVAVGGVQALVWTNDDAGYETLTNGQVALQPLEGNFPGGTQSITIERLTTRPANTPPYILQNVFFYRGAVRITGPLNLDGIQMFPTIGEPGSRIQFTRSTLEPTGYDVYFISDLTNPSFTEAFRSKNVSVVTNPTGDDILNVIVPPIPSGPYYIVFTNPNSQAQGIQRSYTLMNPQFRVVQITQQPAIDSIQPASAPSMTMTDLSLFGVFFLEHNVPGLTLDDPSRSLNYGSGGMNTRVLEVNYGTGELNVGGTLYDVQVTRQIEVNIGFDMEFTMTSEELAALAGLDEGGLTEFTLVTEQFQLEEARTENIVVRMTTLITPAPGLDPTDPAFTGSLLREVVQPNGFTYQPSTLVPNVTSVQPELIPIVQDGTAFYLNPSLDELTITVKGSNFLVTRFLVNNEEQINLPRVRMGGVDLHTLPNEGPDAIVTGYEVLNNGQPVDGTVGNEVGNTIRFTLKAGSDGFPVVNRDSRSVTISNPQRGSSQYAGPRAFNNMVRFVVVDDNDFPVIDNVSPSLVALEGGNPVTITGSNLRTGATLFIGGNQVPNINISGDNRTITFNAPPAQRAGEYQLQVVNPDNGGIATHPFTYTTTYTQPTLTTITPQEGTQGTLVTARGANFLDVDPTVVVENIANISEFLMYRLIGTRIQLDGHEINAYNRNAANQIQLTPFHEGADPDRDLEEPVYIYNELDGTVETGSGFNAVILVEERMDQPDKFYRMVRDVRNDHFIEDGLGGRYAVQYNTGAGTWQAVRGGTTYTLTMPESEKGVIRLTTSGGAPYKTLKAWTPYRVEAQGGFARITGSRVQFINSGTIEFNVPNMSLSPWTGQGLYDVSVVNPDTKRATLTDRFFYYPNPQVTPVVIDVQPERGPEQGGNQVLILGPTDGLATTGFVDTGTTKTRVFLGGQQVPAQDVVISPNGREIRIKVPPYYESIRDRGTDRVTVPLVLVNPDGGTFSINFDNPIVREVQGGDDVVIRGYTYVVPSSNPRIDSLAPAQGSAAGNFVVEIFGFDFRNTQSIFDDEGNLVGTIPAMPEVYFGIQRAEIVEMSSTYLQVIAPPGNGTVPVYVMNADAGISNIRNFTYIASQPRITSVNPDRADRRGGTPVEILGEMLEEGSVTLLQYTDDNDGLSEREEQALTLVRVGQRTNRNLPREHDNSGVFRSGMATVTLAGGVTARFNASLDRLTVEILDRGITYRHVYNGFDDGEVLYVDTTDLCNTTNEEDRYPYRELIRFEVRDNRLFVEGGYAPEVLYRNPRQIVATMPAYYTTGTVQLSVVNPDGGTASTNFVYITPDSRPVITNVTKEGRDPSEETREGYGNIRVVKVSHRGGNVISVYGTDFRPDARISIGNTVNLAPANITYNLPNRLTFTMPTLPENTVGSLYRLVVTNPDGGSATSDQARNNEGELYPIYIEIIRGESDPRLDTVQPAEGPVTGGTRLTLTGNDFRRTMEGFEENPLSVFFGESRVELRETDNLLEFVNFGQLRVTAPASGTVGVVNIRVENPDGELSLPPQTFRYISQPNIATIDPARIFANDANADVTVTGDMFQNGARVFLGGRLVPAGSEPVGETNHGTGIRGVDANGNNLRFSVVGGVAASSVTVTSENAMVLRFPEALDLPNNDLIILNPDGGLSDSYDDFDYAIPVPDAPLVLEAIPGAEGSVQLIWSKSAPEVLNAADRFEVYGKRRNESQFTYIGDARDAQFLVRGLLLDTRYDFMVRALNRYGSAIEFAEVSTRTLSARRDPKLSEKIDELDRQQATLDILGKEEVVGNRVIRTVGSREIPAGTTPYVIDFSAASYSRQNDFVVAFPVAALSSMNRSVRITDGRGSLILTPSHLLTREVSSLTTAQRNDAVVQVNFKRVEGAEATGLASAISRTQSRASTPYSVAFSLQAGRTNQNLTRLLGNAAVTINHDTSLYPNVTNTSLMVYDPSGHRFNSVGSIATFRDPGIYMLLGSR